MLFNDEYKVLTINLHPVQRMRFTEDTGGIFGQKN